MKIKPDHPSTARNAPQPVAAPEQPGRLAGRTGLRAHWLALAAYAIYLGRWGQYLAEARVYRAHPAPGGAGDALNWLLLGQLGFAILFTAVLLANGIWRPRSRRFYWAMSGLVLLPFLLQYLLEG